MKYLIWLLVILLAIWAVKRNRKANQTPAPKAPPPTAPSDMVTCAHCGIHLPQEEAVSGKNGLYCSAEHRTAAHDSNPT